MECDTEMTSIKVKTYVCLCVSERADGGVGEGTRRGNLQLKQAENRGMALERRNWTPH